MTEPTPIRVRYWASARAVAGCDSDELSVDAAISLHEVTQRLADLHPGTRLRDVLAGCSVLVGDQPVSSREATEVNVAPGSSVEFLPPFAGG